MRIRIGQNGKTEIRIVGGQGDDCLAFTRAIEQREMCPEYHDEVVSLPDKVSVSL